MEADEKKKELLGVIKKSIGESLEIAKNIREWLMECANLLRIEQGERVFSALAEGIKNLGNLFEYVRELKNGTEHLKGFNVPSGYFECWEKSLNIFREMSSAFERKDWITLSDLIQYELQPLLLEGEKGLSELEKSLDTVS